MFHQCEHVVILRSPCVPLVGTCSFITSVVCRVTSGVCVIVLALCQFVAREISHPLTARHSSVLYLQTGVISSVDSGSE